MYLTLFICTTLFVSAFAQCQQTVYNVQPTGVSKCTASNIGATEPCYYACYNLYEGVSFGTLATYQCSYGYYGYACQCTYNSKNYKTLCPTQNTDTTPCSNRMLDTWCSTITSTFGCSGQYGQVCRKTCNCPANN